MLVEVHTETEFQSALESDADIIGINNRNLDTMRIDLGTTCRILDGFDGSRPIVSESGIGTPADIIRLRECGASAFLVGSSIMKSDNISRYVKRLAGAY